MNLNTYGYQDAVYMKSMTCNVNVSSNDHVITVTDGNTLLASLGMELNNGVLSLIGKDNYSIASVDIPEAQEITNTFYDENARAIIIEIDNQKSFSINVDDFIEIYKGGKGIEVDEDNNINIKINSASTNYLSADNDGLGINVSQLNEIFATDEALQNLATKLAQENEQINQALNEKADKSELPLKADLAYVNAELDKKSTVDDLNTLKEEIKNNINDLSTALKNEIDTKSNLIEVIDGKHTVSSLNDKLVTVSTVQDVNASINLIDVNTDKLVESLDSKVNTSDIDGILGDKKYATKDDIKNMVSWSNINEPSQTINLSSHSISNVDDIIIKVGNNSELNIGSSNLKTKINTLLDNRVIVNDGNKSNEVAYLSDISSSSDEIISGMNNKFDDINNRLALKANTSDLDEHIQLSTTRMDGIDNSLKTGLNSAILTSKEYTDTNVALVREELINNKASIEENINNINKDLNAKIDIAKNEALDDNNKLETVINNALLLKQDKMVAGKNMFISDENVIDCTLDTTLFIFADKFPYNPDPTKIYFVKKDTASSSENQYIEYYYNTVKGAWEEMGRFEPKIDLSEYAKHDEINPIIRAVNELGDIIETLPTTSYVEEQINNSKQYTDSVKAIIDTKINAINTNLDSVNDQINTIRVAEEHNSKSIADLTQITDRHTDLLNQLLGPTQSVSVLSARSAKPSWNVYMKQESDAKYASKESVDSNLDMIIKLQDENRQLKDSINILSQIVNNLQNNNKNQNIIHENSVNNNLPNNNFTF